MKKIFRYIRSIKNRFINVRNYFYKKHYKKIFGENYWKISHSQEIDFYDKPYTTTSQICNASYFDLPSFTYWITKLKKECSYHRKLWEYAYICQTLYEHGLLQDGKRGVVFGCGKERLMALFASFGCDILATDLGLESGQSEEWLNSNQHIKSDIMELNEYHICDDKEFCERVHYRDVDMNNIPDDIVNYDFCWSTCSLEHIGSIKKGADFIKNSLKTLKKGGIAVHTTEYNLSSNEQTYDEPGMCIFRRKDIEQIISDIEAEGHKVYPLVIDEGGPSPANKYVDVLPHGELSVHLRLQPCGYIMTSIGLIIQKMS